MTETVDAGSDTLAVPMPIDPGSGLKLRQAREARNLSVEDIKSALRLKEGVVEALECDDYRVLPAPIFVKGYLRSYARLVGVGEGPVLAHYQAQGPSDPPLLASAFSNTKGYHPRVPWPIVLGALSFLAIVGVVLMFKSAEQEAPVAQPALTSDPIEELLPEPVAELKSGVQAPILSAVTKSKSGEMLAEAEMGLTYTEEMPAKEPVVTDVSVERVLQFAFDDDCWTEVRDHEGNRLMYELAREGTVRNIEGVPPFSVLLGNAQAVHLKYDGEIFNFNQFVRQNVARFQLGGAEESTPRGEPRPSRPGAGPNPPS